MSPPSHLPLGFGSRGSSVLPVLLTWSGPVWLALRDACWDLALGVKWDVAQEGEEGGSGWPVAWPGVGLPETENPTAGFKSKAEAQHQGFPRCVLNERLGSLLRVPCYLSFHLLSISKEYYLDILTTKYCVFTLENANKQTIENLNHVQFHTLEMGLHFGRLSRASFQPTCKGSARVCVFAHVCVSEFVGMFMCVCESRTPGGWVSMAGFCGGGTGAQEARG